MTALRILHAGSSRAARWAPGPFPAAAPFWRAYWAASDCARLRFGGRTWRMGPAQLIAIAPETAYARCATAPLDHLHLHFSCGLEAGVAPGLYTQAVDPALAARIAATRTALEGDRGAPATAALVLRCCADALLAVPAAAWTRRRIDPRVLAAQDDLRRRLREPPANRELARRAGMHVNAFTRLFRAETGTSPQRWLAEQRAAEACHLLEHGDERIEAIAAAVGCCDRYHFTRLFTRLRGVPPATWRRQARGGG